MSQQDNGRPSLRDYLDMRFNAIDERLDGYCTRQDRTNDDHETRLRTLERSVARQGDQTRWGWVAHIAETIGIVIAAVFGIRQ